METNRAISLAFVLLLLAVVCGCVADSKVGSGTTGSGSQLNKTDSAKEQPEVSSVGSKSDEIGKENKGKLDQAKLDQASKQMERVADVINKDNTTKETGSGKTGNSENDNKETNNKKKGGSNVESQVKEDNQNEKETSSGSKRPKDVPKGKSSGGNSEVPLTKPKKESPHAEECDPSNKCTDKENKLVACLRVPGNESPDLSLLVQNKGKNPLTVTIAAPDFVQLENTKIQLQKEENKRVKVSITKRGQEHTIVLSAGNGRCELDLRDLIYHNFRDEFDNSHKSTYLSLITRMPFLGVLCFAALMTMASGWMCFSFRRKQVSENGPKYQRLEMELPVSGSGKAESEVNDGWDNSWDDDWGDEEAPKTPSMPLTPSLSSKGLASRRLSKEGWKD